MSSSDASSSLPASLSSSLLSVIPSASFSIQSDWEQVLREFLQAKNSSAGTDALAKESKQFWASAARFGEDTSQRESIARLEDDHAAAASSSASSTSSAAAASSSSSSSSASSLAAAARAIRLNTKGPGSSDDLQLSFRSPLQVFIHSTSLNLTQMIQAPRATHMHLHPKGGEVNSVDISSNGNWGLSGGGDGTARVWDVQTGALKADLVGHKGDVVLTRWFPSGVVALTAGLDLSMKLWAVDPAPAQAAQLVGHSRPVTQVVFVGRGRNIISSSEDGTAKLWDVSRQQALTTYPSHKEISPPQLNDCLLLDPTSHPLAFNKSTPMNNVSELEGNLLLTAGEDGIIRGFDLRSSGQVFMLPVGGGGRVGGVEKLMQGMKPHSFMMGTGQGIISMVDLRNKQSVLPPTNFIVFPRSHPLFVSQFASFLSLFMLDGELFFSKTPAYCSSR